jgi:hypothetical protein
MEPAGEEPGCLKTQIATSTMTPTSDPVAMPQPDVPACPLCHIDYDANNGHATMQLQLSTDYAGYTQMNQVVVTLWAGTESERNVFTTIGNIPAPANWIGVTSTALDGVGTGNTHPTKAWIDIQFRDAAGTTFWSGNQLTLN